MQEFSNFKWHEDKRLKNLAQHEIDFEDVPELFSAPYLAKRSDRHSEQRYVAIGVLHDQTITVVYTVRKETCRIISARKARRNEREAYSYAFKERSSQGKD